MNKLYISVYCTAAVAIVLTAGLLLSGCKGQTMTSSSPSSASASTQQSQQETSAPQTANNSFIEPIAGVRPIAVMIDNEGTKSYPQGGLDKAQIVYEILVENGETRLMPLYWGVDPSMIGPVRSSRHYFLDYVLENDAIYVHIGWSPMAERDIKLFKINNINGVGYGGEVFWDITTDKNNWQDSYTSMDKLSAFIKKAKYRTDTTKDLVFKYLPDTQSGPANAAAQSSSIDQTPTAATMTEATSATTTEATSAATIEVSQNMNAASDAQTVNIVYSKWYSCGYQFDSSANSYIRIRKGKPDLERTSGKPLVASNIIIQYEQNATLKGDVKGRQNVVTVGSGKGFYIVEGKSYGLKWSKKDRTSPTLYTYDNGDPILLLPGPTWIQIVPVYSKVTID